MYKQVPIVVVHILETFFAFTGDKWNNILI